MNFWCFMLHKYEATNNIVVSITFIYVTIFFIRCSDTSRHYQKGGPLQHIQGVFATCEEKEKFGYCYICLRNKGEIRLHKNLCSVSNTFWRSSQNVMHCCEIHMLHIYLIKDTTLKLTFNAKKIKISLRHKKEFFFQISEYI